MVLGTVYAYSSYFVSGLAHQTNRAINTLTSGVEAAYSTARDYYLRQIQNHRKSQARFFYHILPKYVQAILTDLHRTHTPDALIGKYELFQIAQRINAYLSQLKAYDSQPIQGLTSSDVVRQSIHDLAKEVKKAQFYQLWSGLSPDAQEILNGSAAFFAPPEPNLPRPLRATSDPFEAPKNVVFDDNHIFRLAGGVREQGKFKFEMPDHPGYSFYKTEPLIDPADIKPLDEVTSLEKSLIEILFDYSNIEKKLRAEHAKASKSEYQIKLLVHQMVLIVHQNRKLLIEKLGLPVDKPTEMSSSGSWEIYEDKPRLPLNKLDFTSLTPSQIDQIAEDIAGHLYVEKVYGINLLGNLENIEDLFLIVNNRAVATPRIGLPRFLDKTETNLELYFFEKMEPLYPDAFNKLISQKFNKLLVNKVPDFQDKSLFIKKLLEKKIATPQDLLKPSSALLRMCKYFGELLHKDADLNHIDTQLEKASPEYVALWLWIQTHAAPVTQEEIQETASLLMRALTANLPFVNEAQSRFEQSLDLVKETAEQLKHKVYAYLAQTHLQVSDESMQNIHVFAQSFLEETANQLHLTFAACPGMDRVSEDFWKIFAEDFLDDFKEELTRFYQKPCNLSEEKILMLQLAVDAGFGVKEVNEQLVFGLHA